MSRVLRESSSRSRKYEDAEAPVGRRNTRDSLFPVPGCSIWTKKMKDHAFRSHLSSFFQLPVKVTGVDPTVLRQLGEALEMIGGFVCGSGAKDLLKLVNYRILFPRLYSHWMYTSPEGSRHWVGMGIGWFSPTQPSEQSCVPIALEGAADHPPVAGQNPAGCHVGIPSHQPMDCLGTCLLPSSWLRSWIIHIASSVMLQNAENIMNKLNIF